jgi:arabinofuranan 3-O-arabinosyltransferase
LTQVGNAIVYSEQPRLINQSSSYSETIRDLGYWQFYGGDQFGPWIPTVRRYVTQPMFVLLGFAVPVSAFLAAWLVRRWRVRLLFALLAIVGVVGMSGIFPTESPTPFGRMLLFSYRHVLAIAGLRTTYKLAGTLNISLAILAGIGLEEAWTWFRRQSGWAFVGRPVLVAGAVAVIGANSFPLWGQYRPVRSAPAIPAYWESALRYLERGSDAYNQFFAPGSLQPEYRWGSLIGTVAETSPSIHQLYAWPFPTGKHYRTNMLAAVERPYQAGMRSENAAVLFRYLGVQHIVLQNDIDWQRSNTASPIDLQQLAQDASLYSETAFGRPGENTVSPASGGLADPEIARLERGLQPVQVLTVPRPLPVVRAESGPPVIVSGDAFGLFAVADEGLLDRNPPVLYSGNLSTADIAAIAEEHPLFVITDSNRRAAQSFSTVRNNTSYTLGPDETLDERPIGWGLFGDRPDTQTTALLQGARTITASGYGSAFADQPELRPANAFDGNPKTAWLVGNFERDVRGWIQLTFQKRIDLARVGLMIPKTLGRRVRLARLEFSDGSFVLAQLEPGANEITFSQRPSVFLRVRIVGVTATSLPNAVGFDEISIPGIRVREIIRAPTDLFRTIERSPSASAALESSSLIYAFERARSGSPGEADQESAIARQFEVPETRRFTITGRVHLDPAASDQDIDRLVAGPSDLEASSSSRMSGNPKLRASAALDGDPNSSWVSAGAVGQWLRARFPTRTVDHVSIQPATGPDRSRITQVEVSFSSGAPVVASIDPQTGLLDARFAPRQTSQVSVKVLATDPGEPQRRTVGIAELQIPGVRFQPVDDSAPVPCLPGSSLSLDGLPISMRPGGTISEILGGKETVISPCGGEQVTLGPGEHRVFVGGTIQPDSIRLTSLRPTTNPRGEAPRIHVHHRTDGGLDVDVLDATRPFFMITGEDWSPNWRASIHGRSLGRALVLDGSSAGWRIDRTGSYRIAVRYGPQRAYTTLLLISAVSLIGTLIFVSLLLLRRGRS